MMIRSATALRNDYDGMVKLSTEKQEPIYLYWRLYVNCKIFRRQHQNGENPKCVIASD